MKQTDLPGLERLLGVCQHQKLSVRTVPPGQAPPRAGTPLGGHPLDPMLAAFYARFGKAVFAPEAAGMGLFQVDDTVNELEAQNRLLQQFEQKQLSMPLFIFGGESGVAYGYVTAPTLADAQGLQPVLFLDPYEDPYALPVASNVDRFFDTYSRYLEALVTHPDYAEERGSALVFPWGVPHLLARDEQLVARMRGGHFDSVLPREMDASTREWLDKVVGVQG